ncbi:MAG: hypothetical protein JNK66_08770 [Chitinophagales bacterium]|nr:hypothetical protein [Chitinophagales bacterium]
MQAVEIIKKEAKALLNDLWWPGRYPLLVLPLALMFAGFVLAYKHAADIVQNEAAGQSFFAALLGTVHAYLSFNLYYFPALVVVNLFTLHLLQATFSGKPVNVAGALLKSVGWKFFKLLPLLLIWMVFQVVFAVFIFIVGLLMALSRGHVGRGAVGKLFQAIALFTIIMQLLLFVVTPGMVVSGEGIFTSIRTMRGYMGRYFDRLRIKGFMYLLVHALLLWLVVNAGEWGQNAGLIDSPQVQLYAVWAVAMWFVFFIQLKLGEFYIKCAAEATTSVD